MPNPIANARQGRLRLGQEIALALTFKVVLLVALWFALFRPHPNVPKPDRADLFNHGAMPSIHQENNNHVR